MSRRHQTDQAAMRMRNQRAPATAAQRARLANGLPARGLSLVELMIGITISLFILAGATVVMTSQLSDTRRLLLEAQVQQDIRAAADMVTRDMRRAGYWAQAWRTVWPDTLAAGLANPYNRLLPAVAPTGTASIEFDRALDESDGVVVGVDNNIVDDRDRSGFRYNGTAKTIEVMVSIDNWQTLTDPNVLEVTAFSITLNARRHALSCSEQCPVVGPTGCPMFQTMRDATLEISARAVHDHSVQRSTRSRLRLRNDPIEEVCP